MADKETWFYHVVTIYSLIYEWGLDRRTPIKENNDFRTTSIPSPSHSDLKSILNIYLGSLSEPWDAESVTLSSVSQLLEVWGLTGSFFVTARFCSDARILDVLVDRGVLCCGDGSTDAFLSCESNRAARTQTYRTRSFLLFEKKQSIACNEEYCSLLVFDLVFVLSFFEAVVALFCLPLCNPEYKFRKVCDEERRIQWSASSLTWFVGTDVDRLLALPPLLDDVFSLELWPDSFNDFLWRWKRLENGDL